MISHAPADVVRPADARPVVVASVPAGHVYVRHIGSVTDGLVTRLPDPDPARPDRSTEQRWWPPVMLDPEWIAHHDFDVMHVQFGFDAWDPADLAAVVDAVHARGRSLVYTAHDLRNPHHGGRELHDAQLAVLVERADAVLTLTPGAAGEVHRRFGRRPEVSPHPHVVDLDTMAHLARHRARGSEVRVGLHVKSLRANLDPAAVLDTLVRTVREIPGGVLQVNGHRDVLEAGRPRFDAELSARLRAAQARGDLELHVHDFLTDQELWAYLASLDVSVLPYRFGTHSGWLEACLDLGTAVVAPTCGYYAEQGPVHSFVMGEDSVDDDGLRDAVLGAVAAGPQPPYSVEHRQRQRAAIARRHAEIYRSLT